MANPTASPTAVQFTFDFGDEVQCRVTKFRGRVVARLQYETGCVQYSVVPEVGDDGKLPDFHWFDEVRLELVSRPGAAVESSDDKPGGPERGPR